MNEIPKPDWTRPDFNPRQCPDCKTDMQYGFATVHATALGFIIAGFSCQHLWFQQEDGVEQIIIKSTDKINAWKCNDCGMILIPKPGLSNKLGQGTLRVPAE